MNLSDAESKHRQPGFWENDDGARLNPTPSASVCNDVNKTHLKTGGEEDCND